MENSVGKITRIANKILGKDTIKTVVEIGAKNCEETLGFATNFPNAKIFSFECNPATLPICRDRVKNHPSITLIEKAVSETDGTVTFFPINQELTETPWEDGNPGASSLLKASGKYKKEKYVQNEITVPSVTLNSFLKEYNIPSIDLLWMDIQGAELMALKSAGKRLSDIRIIHLEVEFIEIYTGQPLMKDIKDYLNKNNFSLYGFTNYGRYFGDAVFIHNSLDNGSFGFRNAIMWPLYQYFLMYVFFLGRLPGKISRLVS